MCTILEPPTVEPSLLRALITTHSVGHIDHDVRRGPFGQLCHPADVIVQVGIEKLSSARGSNTVLDDGAAPHNHRPDRGMVTFCRRGGRSR